MSSKPLLRAALAVTMAIPLAANALDGTQSAYAWAGNWPTHHVFSNGTDLGLALMYQYDADHFGNDGGRFQDAQTNRRKELGVFLKRKGVYKASAMFDFQARSWLDVALQVQTGALVGRDAGALRIGYTKTPVGFEGNTPIGSTTFLESALPTQAIYASRRIGLDWAWVHPSWLVDAGYYWGGDLQGGSDGHMTAARVAWTPRHGPGDVLHLGLSASRETPLGSTDGRDRHQPPAIRFRAHPEAGLTPLLLVDSGRLAPVDAIDRRGIEALWIGGPWSLQSEYLDARVRLADGRPGYHASGHYAFASWVLTGESRSYANGQVGDVKPQRATGAVELALRYSELNLDDAPTLGGRQRDWTLGANWYINRHLELQANYVHARSHHRGVRVAPNVVEARAQVSF